MELGYVKADTSELHAALSTGEALDLAETKNYVPLYSRFFDLRESNSRHMTLNHPLRLARVVKQGPGPTAEVEVSGAGGSRRASAFFKFCPILDPLRYITGRYRQDDDQLLALPDVEGTTGHAKSRDQNNSAYVDGFFSYLSAGLLHHHGVLHALDSYGCFAARKRGFCLDVRDDMDQLAECDFFSEHEGDLFAFDESDREFFALGLGTGRRKPVVVIADGPGTLAASVDVDTANEIQELHSIFRDPIPPSEDDDGPTEVYTCPEGANGDGPPAKPGTASSSACSSRSSGTDGEGDRPGSPWSGSSAAASDAGTVSTCTEDAVTLKIKEFPVYAIALERCEATLDSLILKRPLRAEEWESIMFQVIVSLLAYKKAFGLVHNDLHTNNIMYVKTDKKHLAYRINGCIYKVPTYGRIFKIIDFGRAIYKYRGQSMCSDSFHKHGDAATQYNCEPFMNPKRPPLEPNESFDLCRLGCSLYDFLMEEYEGSKFDPPMVVQMMLKWCDDDKGRNVMYKRSGVERYPNFKLYKMIARTVHAHTPESAFADPCMQRYKSTRSSLGKKARIMDLDAVPDYTGAATNIPA